MHSMKKLLVVGAVIGSASIAHADDRPFSGRLQGPSLFQRTQAIQAPTPDPAFSQPGPAPLAAPTPYGGPQGYSYPATPPLAYPGGAYPGGAYPGDAYPAPHGYPVHAPGPRVKIEDPDHIAPGAVQRTVMVPDPCAPRGHCDDCYGPSLVPITVCVPPCPLEDYECRKDGCYQELDYGKYRVEIRVKKDYIEVDYDD
jgi:hypothetical protein